MRKIFILLSAIVFCNFTLFSPGLLVKNNIFSTDTKKPSQTTQQKNKNLCGPRSLLAICQILAVEATLDELSRLSGLDKDTGTTMLGLSQAAQRKGLKAEGVKMKIEELAKLKSPCIAHTKGNHFFVVESFEKSRFRILDPPKEPYCLTKEELSKIWDSNVLVISRKPPSVPEEPNIIFTEYLYHFGRADQNEKIEHIFKFKNTGKKPLTVSKVRTTCGCMAALLSDKEIAQGEEGQIKATFSTGSRRGKQSQLIYVHSNDPDEPLIKIILTGRIKAYLTISPKQLYFGNIQKGKGAIRRINIFEGEERIRITRIEPTSKYLFTEVFNTFYNKRPGYEVIVALSPNTPIGALDENLIIHTDSKKKPKIEIPITGQIKGPIGAYPNSFFFGFAKQGESLTRKIILSADEQSYEILKAETRLNFISTRIKAIEKNKKYQITATLSPDAPEGTIKGSITIHTNNPDQPVIDVLVYALVQ